MSFWLVLSSVCSFLVIVGQFKSSLDSFDLFWVILGLFLDLLACFVSFWISLVIILGSFWLILARFETLLGLAKSLIYYFCYI